MKLRTYLAAVGLTMMAVTSCGSTRHEPLVDANAPGALLGAYVAPDTYTDPGRIEGLEKFEKTLGRRLDIVHTYHKWAEPFPSEIDRYVAGRGDVLLLSWAHTAPEAIVGGEYDAMIRERAQALEALGTPVLLRWRWEMNRPNLREEITSPEIYVEAWKHIRAVFDEVDVENVDWVWCPSANGFVETNGAEYYPGDDQVDWLCADAYTPTPEEPLQEVLEPFMEWARDHELPIVIGEFGTRQGVEGARARWLDAAMRYFHESPRVKAVVTYESPNAPAGRYDVAEEPSALATLVEWGRSKWLNPRWSPAN